MTSHERLLEVSSRLWDRTQTRGVVKSSAVRLGVRERERERERERVESGSSYIHSTVTRICLLTDGGTPLDATHSYTSSQ